MVHNALRAALLLSGAWSVMAQFVPTPSNFTTKMGNNNVSVRYKEVPTGICEMNSSVKSYAGYSDVSDYEHYFFWFFEARTVDPTTAPLTIWINGGPGSTSMYGLFQELGPCHVGANGSAYNNPYSWSEVSNMVFIDEPVGVGFSYSTASPGYIEPVGGTTINLPNATCPDYAEAYGTCGTYSAWNISATPNSTDAAAPLFYAAVQGFIGAFPQYTNGGINFWTESYGGHYLPVFARYMVEASPPVPLNNTGIGNGWYDPLLNYQAYYNYTVNPGNPYLGTTAFNESIQNQMYNALYGPGNCVEQLEACASTGNDGVCMTADQFCAFNVELTYDNVLGRDEYDIRELLSDPFPPTFFVDYLNSPQVQEAVGAFTNFSTYSNLVGGSQGTVVGGAFGDTGDDGREVNTIEDISYLLANNVSVQTYFGDADYNCNYLGGFAALSMVNTTGFVSAGFQNITVDGLATTQGEVKQAGLFSYTRVFYSGHEVPFYQPELALAFFTRAMRRLDVATGTIAVNSSYSTSGSPDLPTFFEGNSTVQNSDVPANATYNTTTHEPNPYSSSSSNSTSANLLTRRMAWKALKQGVQRWKR